MSIIPLEWKLAAGAVAALALAAAVAGVVSHERSIGASEVTAAVADQHAKDIDAARAHEAQITADQQEAYREANRFNQAAALGAERARGADQRLQQRFAAVNARCLPGDPAASAGGPAAGDDADVRADVFRRVVEAARLAASAADASRGAGQLAERSYDALKR